MATGRGEFFQSFMEGLERTPAQPVAVRRPNNHGRGKPGARFAGPDRGQAGGRRTRRRRGPVRGTEPR